MTTLLNDDVLALSGILGVQTLPPVLAVAPQQDSLAEWADARERSLAGLRASGVLDSYDDVVPDVAAALRILSHPERQLVIRVRTTDGSHRACLARRGTEHAVAFRVGDTFDITTTWADDSGAALSRAMLDALGSCPPADIPTVSAPSVDLRERLDSAACAADFTQAAYALGVPESAAVSFGLAISTCHTHAEIVAYAHDDGANTRSAGAVAVYDTERGRIVASPGTAPDLRVWSTLAPGSDQRIAQAISALVETLPGGRWLP